MRGTMRGAAFCGICWLALGVASLVAVSPPCHAGQPADVPAASVIEHGLAVHLGTSDGTWEAELAADGRVLVHGLALDDRDCAQARQLLLEKNLYGIASVETWQGPQLPYPSRMINLLVADLDALGKKAPPAEEISRVLVPGGVALLKKSGKWTRTAAAWPKELDDWTHFAYGPQGNAVSQERLAGPTTSLKWIAGVRGQDLRIARGMLFSPLSRRLVWHQQDTGEMRGRDAFNGLLYWSCPTGGTGYTRPLEWAAAGHLVFHFPSHRPCYAVATDARTGQVVRTFDRGVKRPHEDELGHGNSPGVAVQLVYGRRLIQSYGRRVVALDVDTGDAIWSCELAAEVAFMSADDDGRHVFLHEVADATRGRARWGKHQTVAVTCLEEGKPLWRNRDLQGEEVSDLVYHDGALYVFDPTTNLGDDGNADVWKLSARDGRMQWAGAGFKQNYNVSLNSILIRDGKVWSWGPFNNLRCYDAANGEETNLTISGYNQRCTRMSATADWLIFGFTSWVDRQGNWTQTALGRSDCSLPAYPAHGQLFFGSNITCHCLNPLRGIVALTPPGQSPQIADGERLERLSGQAQPGTAVPGPAPEGPISGEWQPDPLVFYLLDPTTEPVSSGDLRLVAHVHRHLLVASRGDRVAWTFVAGGRIYGPPLVAGDRCFVGAADGYLYCLDARTGAPQWRFLAAPAARKVVAYNQLESAWPIYNVVEHDGSICVAAGRHAELDGGLFLWGLDPASGEVRWKTILHTPPTVLPVGEKPEKLARPFLLEVQQKGAINGGLAVAGGRLKLRSPFFDKRGSSPSRTGYFQKPPSEGGQPTFHTFDLDPIAFNGKTVNPQEMVELTKTR